MINLQLPFRPLRARESLSEREVVGTVSLSRGALRSLEAPERSNFTVGVIHQLASFFNRDVEVIVSARDTHPECSTVALAYKIERDGFDSWKMHLFDFVDEFRRTLDGRLFNLPPPAFLDKRLLALLSSTVRALCDEAKITPPPWAMRRQFLPSPWFVSGVNALKAAAILESPLPFRVNNIFVQANFLSRA